MFTDGEKALLRELAMNSTWGSIMRKLDDFHRAAPGYKPDKGTADQQKDDWVYRSGVEQGAGAVLKLLRNE
jgi:hypothetical protein